MSAPIEFYYWPTPNCWKVAILLEELGADYQLRPVDIGKGEQYESEYTLISPNNRVPAITDPEPPFGGGAYHLFESGAILEYLAEKFGRFLPSDPAGRYLCKQWLYWQMGGLGPMGGQAHHFRIYAREKIPYAIDRYTNECHRLYGVLDAQLSRTGGYVAGELSIADFACLPWIYRHKRQGQHLEAFPALFGWYQELMARPTVVKGFSLAASLRDEAAFTGGAGHDVLFGSSDKNST